MLALTPARTLACAVCALVGSGDNTWAYKAMSVMLILLPLGMIGGAVLWLSRMAARADAERPSPAPSLDSGHATAFEQERARERANDESIRTNSHAEKGTITCRRFARSLW